MVTLLRFKFKRRRWTEFKALESWILTPSPVPIRVLHREGVWQVPHFSHRAIRQQDLYNVEAQLYRRVSQQAQVVERGPR